jgi:MFS family permease
VADAAPRALAGWRSRPARLFYGWRIVGVGAALQALQAALLGQAYGAYVVVLRAEFGWSTTMLAAASSLREAETGILGPVHGTLVDRLGPRRVASIGAVILGIGFMLFSQVHELWQFYGAFIVMSIGASMSGFLTASVAAVRWFERRRATAIALISAGWAVGGMCVPLTVLLLEQLGWRATAFISGVVIILVALPLAQVYRSHPGELGLLPDGAAPPRGPRDPASPAPREPVARDFTLGEAIRTPAFWLISFGHASALFVVSSLAVHLVSHVRQALGYTLGQASTVVLALTFTFMVGNLTGGFIGDRVNKRGLLVACMAMHCAGLLMLSHAVNAWMVAAFVVIHGLAWGWRGPQMTAIRADYFGRASFGRIMGVSNMVILTGTIFGPLIAGVLYDRTGNYRLGFDILAVMALAGSVFFLLARRPSPPLHRDHGGQ